MLLSVRDRIILLQVLPRQGNVTNLRIIRDLEREMGFSEEETTALKLESSERGVKWDKSSEVDKEIAIGEVAAKLIHDAFVDLDKRNALSLEHLDVYDKFVVPAATKPGPVLVPSKN